jgi:hypothetical protein
MSKNYIVMLLLISCFSRVMAQKKVEFGVIGGAFYGNVEIKTSGVDLGQALALIGENDNALDVLDGGGLYVGFVAEVRIIEDLSIQSELFYAGAGDESIIGLPIVVKYYVGKSFNVQGGPQLDIVLGLSDFADQFFDSFGYSAVLGLGYDFSPKIAIQTRYAFGLRNRLDNAISEALSSIKPSLRTNTLQLGLIYKFN